MEHVIKTKLNRDRDSIKFEFAERGSLCSKTWPKQPRERERDKELSELRIAYLLRTSSSSSCCESCLSILIIPMFPPFYDAGCWLLLPLLPFLHRSPAALHFTMLMYSSTYRHTQIHAQTSKLSAFSFTDTLSGIHLCAHCTGYTAQIHLIPFPHRCLLVTG